MANNKKYKYTQDEFLKIIYDLVGDEYTVLSEYKGNRNKILMRHNICGNEWRITPSNFIEHGTRCPVENGKNKYSTKEYKQKLYTINPNIDLLDKYVNADTKLHFKCLKDGYVFLAKPKQVLRGNGCPCCAGRKIVIGINDLNTTNPEVSKFLDNYNDGFDATYGTHKKLTFKCPNCFSLKRCRPNGVLDINGKYKCSVCGDGISYPEKFMASVLEQLDIEYIYQLTHTYYDWIGNYRYDFYIPNKNLIIEMNGLQHYCDSNSWKNISDNTDSIKYELAKSNGIEHIVYVDARSSDFEYIKSNIINSLSNYFDFSNINWEKCGENANKSLMIEVCKYIENNENFDSNTLSEHFNLCSTTILSYIKEGSKLGLCSLDKYKYYVHKNRNKKITDAISNDIICIETGEIFQSISYVNREYNIHLVGIKNKPRQFGLTWEYYTKNKEYPHIYNFTLKEYVKRYNELTQLISKINQYDENLNYVKTYDSLKELSKLGYSSGSISKYMTKHSMVYSSYWFYSFDPSQFSKEHIQELTPTPMDNFIIKGSYQKEIYNNRFNEEVSV